MATLPTVPRDVLDDPSFTVPPPLDAAAVRGVDGLRAAVVRFCDGEVHARRRRTLDAVLAGLDVRPAVDRHPTASLLAALGLPATLVPEVDLVASAYHPHLPTGPAADAAADRLVAACGAPAEEAAARACLVVQAHAATQALLDRLRAGSAGPPVPVTRRLGPDGSTVLADLTDAPYGRGPHACPGRELALRLAFFALHAGPVPLVLPNAWDVASAWAFAGAGFPAVATTSLGVSAARGLVDGTGAARDAVLDLAAALRTLPCPVSVDLEDGFAGDPDGVAQLVAGLGIAGVNPEDSTRSVLVPPAAHARTVAAVKRRAPSVFVNARVDTVWLRRAEPAGAEGGAARGDLPATTRERAHAYVAAGADGVFVPGPLTPTEIAGLVRELPVPLNVLPARGLTVAALADLGVRRVSTGSLPYRAALRHAVDAARAVRDGAEPPGAVPYEDVQALARRHRAAAGGAGRPARPAGP